MDVSQAVAVRFRALVRPSPIMVGGSIVLVSAVVLATLSPAPTGPEWGTALILLVAQAVASWSLLEFRWYSQAPTKAVVVAALLLVPLPLVPLLVIVGRLIPVLIRRRPDMARSVAVKSVLVSGVFAAVFVLTLAGVEAGTLGPWWIYLVALVAHFALDVALRCVVDRRRLRFVPRLPLVIAQAAGVDLLLVAIGLGVVFAAREHWAMVGFLLAPVVLIAVLTADQRGLGLQVSRARAEARIDPLTGLGNRRAWLEAIEAVSATRPDRRAPIGVVMADLDNLKLANDTLGHPVGDELIAAVGAACAEAAPAGSVVCRIGGDEFAVLIRDASGDRSACAVADHLRELVGTRGQVHGVLLSAGVGAADCPPLTSVAQAVQAADAMVLAEKQRRRPAMPRQRSRVLPASRSADDSEPTIRLSQRLDRPRRQSHQL